MRFVTILLLVPRNVAIVLLRAYRAAISPLYGDVCRYYPSCSHYTLHAVQEYGVLRGGALGALRIARCHPWADPRIDELRRRPVSRYELTTFGFVVPGHGKG
jgi:hypothetical protein